MQRGLGSVLPSLVRPRSQQVCFASIPDFSESAYALYRHLLETRSDLDFVWLLHDVDAEGRIREHFEMNAGERGHSLQIVDWKRPQAYIAYLRSSVVFHTHGVFNFSRPQRDRTVVSLWHGMPIKVIGALERGGPWRHDVGGDLHIATSRLFRYVIAAAFDAPVDRVLLTGLPRADVLKGIADPEHDKVAICTALGVDSDEHVIVWLPTHRTDGAHTGSFVDDVDHSLLAELLDSCSRSGCRVVVKPHPYDRFQAGSLGELSEHPALLVVEAEAWSSCGVQLYDLLSASCGLITDISSVLVDYLHTGRPMAMFAFDEDAYGRETVLPLAPLVGSPSLATLDGKTNIATFVAAVTTDTPVRRSPSDVAAWLVEDGDIHASEAIACAVGL